MDDCPPDKHALNAKARFVLQHACERGVLVATAESRTGGYIASLLTDIPGLSHGFDRGFVTYTVGAKCAMLGIDRAEIERYGAVSEGVTALMARRALMQSASAAALAVSGYIGGAPPGAEDGLVHIVAIDRAGHLAHRECRFGPVHREPGRDLVAGAALDQLGALLAGHPSDGCKPARAQP